MQDFAKELGSLGFTMRLKRLSDMLMHDGRKMYKSMKMDIEPNWFVVFQLLKKQGDLSVTQIADKIQWAHPSVIALTNKMMKAGYLTSTPCKLDQRRRVLSLSEKTLVLMPKLEQIWEAGEKGVIKALEGTNAMQILDTLEERFGQKGFGARTFENMEAATNDEAVNTVELLDFDEGLAPHFAQMNYEWLEKYFVVEPHDREMLDAPKEYIIDKEGQIFFARYHGEIVGTAALIVEDENTLELAKMAVTSKYQGLKIGKQLIQHCIRAARKTGKRNLVLESNTKLTNALNLYIKTGFMIAPLAENSPYSRCNIRMHMTL